MAWHQTGDKLSSELMLSQFTDAHMRHRVPMSEKFTDASGCH